MNVHTHTHKQTNTSAYMHGLKHTPTHAHSHRCVYAQSSRVPRSPMKKCQVPFDRYRNGLHVSSTSRPKVCIVISVKKTKRFPRFQIECTHADSDTNSTHIKSGNRSMLTHAHTEIKCTGQILSFAGKKILCQWFFFCFIFS